MEPAASERRPERGIRAARFATVRIADAQGNHRGNGLLLDGVDALGSAILTCHHVLAPLEPGGVFVSAPNADDELGAPVAATYDGDRSRPDQDLAVLRIAALDRDTPSPVLCEIDIARFSGGLPVTGITHLEVTTFSGTIRPYTKLTVKQFDEVRWPNSPERYHLPYVLPIDRATDVRPGISGGVVVCEGGVLGLVHFARETTPQQSKEAYVVPLTAWAHAWPDLRQTIEPLVDDALLAVAKVRRSGSVRLGLDQDLVIAAYSENYVARDADRDAAAAFERHGDIMIVGRPGSGKTRLASVVLARHPGAVAVIPTLATPPAVFVTAGFAGRDVILVFDDVHATAPFSQPLAWAARFNAATGRRCRTICTARDGREWDDFVARPETALFLRSYADDAFVYTSENEERGHDFTLDEALELGKQLRLDDVEVTARFDGTPGSLTLDLQMMAGRYSALRREHVDGTFMSVLLDAAKLLSVGAGVPELRETTLRLVAERVRRGAQIGASVWETVCRRTAAEGFGRFDDRQLFKTYRPYLERCVDYEPELADVFALEAIFIEGRDFRGLCYLGAALGSRHHEEDAVRVLRRAVEGEPAYANFLLGAVLGFRLRRIDEALAALRASMDAGNAYAALLHGRLLARRPETWADAEESFRIAIQGDADAAYVDLGQLLAKQPKRSRDAEDAYRTAIDRDHSEATVYLADLLARTPSRRKEAAELYRHAIKHGHEVARLGWARLLARKDPKNARYQLKKFLEAMPSGGLPQQQRAMRELAALLGGQTLAGTDADADMRAALSLSQDDQEEMLRALTDKGIAPAHLRLGESLQERPENAKEAESHFRTALDHGDLRAGLLLGRLLVKNPARHAEAEDVLRQAADAGVAEARLELARLLGTMPDRERAAEQTFRAAIAAGQRDAYVELGRFLARRPDMREAASEAFADAVQAGFPEGWYELGTLFANDPDRAVEAEAAFNGAIRGGVQRAYVSLGELLAQDPLRLGNAASAFRIAIDAHVAGARERAETALRAADRAGFREALLQLGDVLLDHDPHGAEEAYASAAEKGVALAFARLGYLMMASNKRFKEAKKMFRSAMEAGVPDGYLGMAELLAKDRSAVPEALRLLRSDVLEGNPEAAVLREKIRARKAIDESKRRQWRRPSHK